MSPPAGGLQSRGATHVVLILSFSIPNCFLIRPKIALMRSKDPPSLSFGEAREDEDRPDFCESGLKTRTILKLVTQRPQSLHLA